MSSTAEHRARSFTTSPISTCRRIRRRAICQRELASRDCAFRKRATERWIGTRTTGSPFSAPPISARSANSRSTACRLAASRLTLRLPIGRKSFPTSPTSISSPRVGDTITLYALMEGPSIVGAFKFLMTRAKGVVMDIQTTHVHARPGLALRHRAADFDVLVLRDQEGDRDRLAPGGPRFRRSRDVVGQRRATLATAQQSAAHHGLGLCRQQPARFRPPSARPGIRSLSRWRLLRRRPSLWVEPLPGPSGEGWGKGSIQLCEIPTDDEIHDNVVAMWVPADPVPAGAELNLNYRLHWLANEPYPSKLAPVWATRLGRGGQPGLPRPKGVRKFMVEFLGRPAARSPFWRQTRTRRVSLARNLRTLPTYRGRSRRRRRPLASAVRPYRRRDRSGRAACISQVRRRDSDRDLDVSVPPVLAEKALDPPRVFPLQSLAPLHVLPGDREDLTGGLFDFFLRRPKSRRQFASVTR